MKAFDNSRRGPEWFLLRTCNASTGTSSARFPSESRESNTDHGWGHPRIQRPAEQGNFWRDRLPDLRFILIPRRR